MLYLRDKIILLKPEFGVFKLMIHDGGLYCHTLLQ